MRAEDFHEVMMRRWYAAQEKHTHVHCDPVTVFQHDGAPRVSFSRLREGWEPPMSSAAKVLCPDEAEAP